MPKNPLAVGVFWYRNALDYEAFLKLFSDAHVLPSSYSSWKRQADQGHAYLLREGHFVVKAEATPEEFMAWAKRTSHDVNAAGRTAFANLKALEYLGDIRRHEADASTLDNDIAH